MVGQPSDQERASAPESVRPREGPGAGEVAADAEDHEAVAGTRAIVDH